MEGHVKTETGYLNGSLLLAMPSNGDPRFDRAVIYVCAHDENGAMGITINKKIDGLKFGNLLKDLDVTADITLPKRFNDLGVLQGGPVETGRGFLIHSNDFKQADTIEVQDDIYVTGTVDALTNLNEGQAPEYGIFALGYAGWTAGQLEQEVYENAWLTLPAPADLVFHQDETVIWHLALEEIGISAAQLSAFSGRA